MDLEEPVVSFVDLNCMPRKVSQGTGSVVETLCCVCLLHFFLCEAFE